MIETLATDYPVRLLCRVLDLPASSYYYQPTGNDDLSVLVQIEAILAEFPVYGYRRVAVELHRRGYPINRKRVLRLLRENDLVRPLRRRVRTTHSDHSFGRYPNLLKGYAVLRPDEVWCADITYIQLRRQVAYLAVIIDVFTRSIRGWHLGRSLSTDLALNALRPALAERRPEIHHSDQGVQYAATGYVELLQAAGVRTSMAGRGRPVENPYAERVIRTIKEEEVTLNEYETLADARRDIGHFIEVVYQTKRVHSSLGYLTPAEFEAQWALEIHRVSEEVQHPNL